MTVIKIMGVHKLFYKIENSLPPCVETKPGGFGHHHVFLLKTGWGPNRRGLGFHLLEWVGGAPIWTWERSSPFTLLKHPGKLTNGMGKCPILNMTLNLNTSSFMVDFPICLFFFLVGGRKITLPETNSEFTSENQCLEDEFYNFLLWDIAYC